MSAPSPAPVHRAVRSRDPAGCRPRSLRTSMIDAARCGKYHPGDGHARAVAA